MARTVRLDPARCQQSVMSGWHAYQCQRTAGPSGYCKQHDPATRQAAAAVKRAEADAWRQASDATEARGRALLAEAGLTGMVFYSTDRVQPGYQPTVLLSFDTLTALIARLRSRVVG